MGNAFFWRDIQGQQFDVVLLGMLVPASTLGLYSIAKLLVGNRRKHS